MRRYAPFRSTPAQVVALPSVGGVTETQTVRRRRGSALSGVPGNVQTLQGPPATAGGGIYTAALTEAAAAADATTAVVTLLAVLTEAASLADALAALLVAVADVAEPATAVELLSTGAQYAGTLLEEIIATDTMAAAATLVALLTEPATAADAAAGSYPATYTCSVAELASVLEQMVAVLGTEVFTASARTRIGPATLMDAAERIGSRTTVPGLASRVGGKSI